MIIWIVFPINANSQTIQNGSWSTTNGDVTFYISQHSQIDTLSVRITHTASNCSGSLTKYYYGISIIDRSFSTDLGSAWDGSTGSITGDFSQDGTSCSGSYLYTEPPCSPVSVIWTAVATDPDTTEVLVEIDDLNFLSALIEQGVDTNGDDMISHGEAEAVVSLDISDREISDMKGIEAFVNLDTLNCINNQLTSLDISGNQNLEILWCRDNQISNLDVSDNPVLSVLYCSNNLLSGLDVSNNILLSRLYCEDNLLTSLDVSNNPDLWRLWCSNNQLTSLDVSNNSDLQDLWCGDNQISSLDVSKNLVLMYLWCEENLLATLDVSNNTLITELVCYTNKLTSLDVSKNLVLTELWCGDNLLTGLDVENNQILEVLSCRINEIMNLDVSNNPYLEYLSCGNNEILNLDVSNNPALLELWCYNNILTSLDVSNITLITKLVCWANKLTGLNISNNHALKELWCGDNLLISLDVSNNPNLEVLSCHSNKLLNLDVSNNPVMMILNCGGNQIGSLDISANAAIGTADSEYNALNVSNMPSLYEVCVWIMPFPPPSVTVYTASSPNVYFTTECSGANSIEEIRQSALSLYPNPFRDKLTIRTDNFGELSITVTSTNGQIVKSRNFVGNLHRIDLSSIQRGIYFINIRSENFVITEKIIKL